MIIERFKVDFCFFRNIYILFILIRKIINKRHSNFNIIEYVNFFSFYFTMLNIKFRKIE